MYTINYSRIYSNLASFTNLPIRAKGRKYIGQCYYSGRRHKSRRDKLTCYMKLGKIFLVEQGEQPVDLWKWMKLYGNYSSDLEIGNALREESGHLLDTPAFIEPEVKHVYDGSMRKTLGLYSDNLFCWLTTLFPVKDVKMSYSLYNIGSDGQRTVFWMIDSEQNICHDKIMLFDKTTGKRQGCPSRKFKIDFGFTDTPAFGDHLLGRFIGQKIYVMESEKSSVLFYLRYKKLCVATSGASCLYKTKPDQILLPDFDKAGEKWLEKGNAIKWWEYYPDYQPNDSDDMGDFIIKERKSLLIRK